MKFNFLKGQYLPSIFIKKLYERSEQSSNLQFQNCLNLLPSKISSKENFFPIILYLRFTENNIFVILKDLKTDQILLNKSSGLLGFQGRNRQTTEVCYMLVTQILECLVKYSIKFFSIEILGRHRLRRFFLRQLLRKGKPKVRKFRSNRRFRGKKKRTQLEAIFFPNPICIGIRENLKEAFNGCRQPKPRRK
jgi:ribosomal protein S11